jgi:hypothetical protein
MEKTSCTIGKYLVVLSHELTKFDRELEARGQSNIYRLGHYMGALQRVEKKVKSVLDKDRGKPMLKFLDAVGSAFEADFPPIKRLARQIELGTCRIK